MATRKKTPRVSTTEVVGSPLHEIQEEFVSIAEMQNAIMPATHDYRGYGDYEIYGLTLPTRFVGGDFYDFVDFEQRFQIPGQLGIVIADASGHGLSAAMLIRDFNTALYTAISFHTRYVGDTTAEFFEMINRRLFRWSLANQFITAFYSELHLDGRIRYINAGHLPPLIFKETGEVELAVGGPVLGAIYLVPKGYQVGERRLDPGDVLVCYTDGITEAANLDGEEYGLQRLKQVVRTNRKQSSRQLFNSIVSDVGRFTGSHVQVDDWTLIIVKKGIG
jgi:sigma-B regulation protein RsbU (phosphoserine phosphatase)